MSVLKTAGLCIGVQCLLLLFVYGERYPVFAYTFHQDADYAKHLRTAFGCKYWEIVADETAVNSSALRTLIRFEKPTEEALLILDLSPMRLSALSFRVRSVDANGVPVSIRATFGNPSGAVVFKKVDYEPSSDWKIYRCDIESIETFHWQGSVVPTSEFSDPMGPVPTVHKIYISIGVSSKAEGGLNRDLILEFDCIEAFTE